MSVDFQLALTFNERASAANRFQRINSAILDSHLFTDALRVCIYKYDLYVQNHRMLDNAIVECHTRTYDSPVNEEAVADFASRYPESDYRFEAWWSVPRYRWGNSRTPELSESRVEFYTYDPGFLVYSLTSLYRTNSIFSASNDKYYDVSQFGDVAATNLNYLLNELAFFSQLDVSSITGVGRDEEPDPRSWHIKYCSEGADFTEDLKMFGAPSQVVNERMVRRAAERTDETGLFPTTSGFLVYSKLGTGGNLKDFYEKLLELSNE